MDRVQSDRSKTMHESKCQKHLNKPGRIQSEKHKQSIYLMDNEPNQTAEMHSMQYVNIQHLTCFMNYALN